MAGAPGAQLLGEPGAAPGSHSGMMEKKTEEKIRNSEVALKKVTGTPKMGFFAVVSLSIAGQQYCTQTSSNFELSFSQSCSQGFLIGMFTEMPSSTRDQPGCATLGWASAATTTLLKQNAAVDELKAAGRANGRSLHQNQAGPPAPARTTFWPWEREPFPLPSALQALLGFITG